MYKNKKIKENIENIKYLYNRIQNGEKDSVDEYICSYQIVNNYSLQTLPKKYNELYNKIAYK